MGKNKVVEDNLIKSGAFYKAYRRLPAGQLVLSRERLVFLPSRLFPKIRQVSIGLREIVSVGSKRFNFWQTLWCSAGFASTFAHPWGFPWFKSKVLIVRTARKTFEFIVPEADRWVEEIRRTKGSSRTVCP